MSEKEESKKILEVDRLSLELAKMNEKLSTVQVEKSIAYNELAKLHYRYLVLQVYMKYGLTENETINEVGEIITQDKEKVV